MAVYATYSFPAIMHKYYNRIYLLKVKTENRFYIIYVVLYLENMYQFRKTKLVIEITTKLDSCITA